MYILTSPRQGTLSVDIVAYSSRGEVLQSVIVPADVGVDAVLVEHRLQLRTWPGR
jgi:hypothetical protein